MLPLLSSAFLVSDWLILRGPEETLRGPRQYPLKTDMDKACCCPSIEVGSKQTLCKDSAVLV